MPTTRQSTHADDTAIDHHPTGLAAGLAVVFATVSAWVVADGVASTAPLLYAAVGVLFLVAGGPAVLDAPDVGRFLSGLGVVLLLGAYGVALGRPPGRVGAAVLYPGLVGVTVLGLALRPVRPGWTTKPATVGTGLVFTAVLLAGVTHAAGRVPLLVGTVGAVAAWDAARYAATLGRQVGRTATTYTAEAVHTTATVLVGGCGLLATEAVWAVGVSSVPLEGLLVLLAAAVAFLVVLYT